MFRKMMCVQLFFTIDFAIKIPLRIRILRFYHFPFSMRRKDRTECTISIKETCIIDLEVHQKISNLDRKYVFVNVNTLPIFSYIFSLIGGTKPVGLTTMTRLKVMITIKYLFITCLQNTYKGGRQN